MDLRPEAPRGYEDQPVQPEEPRVRWAWLQRALRVLAGRLGKRREPRDRAPRRGRRRP